MRPYFLVHHDHSSVIVFDDNVPAQFVNGVGPAEGFERFVNGVVEDTVRQVQRDQPHALQFTGVFSGVVRDEHGFGYHLQSYTIEHEAIGPVMDAFHDLFAQRLGQARVGTVIDLNVDMQGWSPTEVIHQVVATVVPTLSGPRY